MILSGRDNEGPSTKVDGNSQRVAATGGRGGRTPTRPDGHAHGGSHGHALCMALSALWQRAPSELVGLALWQLRVRPRPRSNRYGERGGGIPDELTCYDLTSEKVSI